MRGDDVIAIGLPTKTASLRLLKTEVKSRTSLSAKVVEEARLALNSGGGLPSPHALAFVSDRLHELGQDTLADLISLAQLKDGILGKTGPTFGFCVLREQTLCIFEDRPGKL